MTKNYFSREELSCQHCGKDNFSEDALNAYNAMRHECGFPWVITSAYRCEEHPIEKAKIAKGRNPGAHTRGTAIDVHYHDDDELLTILKTALNCGVKRVGINDKGEQRQRFVHLDFDEPNSPSPAFWLY